MPSRLSYEPSVQAVLANALPASARLVGGKSFLRARVSWPLMTRATGLGQIQGGEVVLVPSGRWQNVQGSIPELAAMGVVAIVTAGGAADGGVTPEIPVAFVPSSTDMRRLQEDMERYIIRRRRELFELTQELHRALVEEAIAGLSVDDLLRAAARASGKSVFLDQDGDVLQDRDDAPPLEGELLSRVRIACREPTGACVQVEGARSTLAIPVVAGKERRGIAGILGTTDSALDEDEVIVTTLASALAIALAREPLARPPTLEDALSGSLNASHRGHGRLTDHRAEEHWSALAVRDSTSPSTSLERAVSAELGSRGLRFLLARQEDVLMAFVEAGTSPRWELVVEALQRRLASQEVEAGASRQHRGAEGARRAATEALEALQRSPGPGTTRFEAIELQVLLAALPGWQDFVQGRLGPLLEGNAGRTELLHTLAVYLSTGRNGTESARLLQVHRNTLLYRLRRLKELLDFDPDDPEDAFGLELSLRVWKAHGGPVNAGGDSD